MKKQDDTIDLKSLNLADDFPPNTCKDWRNAAEKLLKGKPFDETLLSETYENITVQPIYFQGRVNETVERSVLLAFDKQQNTWEIAQERAAVTPREYNAALLHALANGQTAVNLRLDKLSTAGPGSGSENTGEAGQGSASISTVGDLQAALANVNLEKFPIYIHCATSGLLISKFLTEICKEQKFSLKNLRGCIGNDPLSEFYILQFYPERSREAPNLSSNYDEVAQLTTWSQNQAPNLQTIWVHGDIFHNAGGNAVQELAFSIAAAVEYIREMLARNLTIDAVAPRIRFAFGLGENFFMEIAKLRAARLVWSNVISAFNGSESAKKMAIHGSTSRRNKMAVDPHVNMLRATTEALSGIVGGCDSLHIAAFDEPVRFPDEFSHRIARNIQIILKEESFLERVIDPAGGSWYVETLTKQIAENAWKQFQEIEAMGGIVKALQNGFPQGLIEETARRRKTNFESGSDKFVGANAFQNPAEKPLEKRDPGRIDRSGSNIGKTKRNATQRGERW